MDPRLNTLPEASVLRLVETAERLLKSKRLMVVLTFPVGREVTKTLLARPSIGGIILHNSVEREKFDDDPRVGSRYGTNLSRWTFPHVTAAHVAVLGPVDSIGFRVAQACLIRGFKSFIFLDPAGSIATRSVYG